VLATEAKAAGLCPRIVPYFTKPSSQGLFLTAMNARAWNLTRNSLTEPEEEALSAAGQEGELRWGLKDG